MKPKSTPRTRLNPDQILQFVDRLYADDLHAKRILSLAQALQGVLHAALLSIHAIGQAYALLAGITPKSGTKQVDRTLSNPGLPLQTLLRLWVKFVVSGRKELVLALDWTDFSADDHQTLCAYVVTSHGRATPLYWVTVKKSELAGKRTALEHQLVERLHEWIEEEVDITLLADRGFGDQKLYDLLSVLGWDFVIRFRGNILVQTQDGRQKAASEWVPANGRATMLKKVRVTGERTEVPAVVVVKGAQMKEVWCLATSLVEKKPTEVSKLYGKRFSIEETFRDQKDLHFGLGLSATHIKEAARRDRLLLLTAMAQALLTLLGGASEACGLDKKLQGNAKKRKYSLFRQGLYWYQAIPTMREEWLIPLMQAFDQAVREHEVFRGAFGLI